MRPISAEASRGYSHLTSGTSKGSFIPLLQLKRFPTYPSPLERKHEGPAHIQRSLVSTSSLEIRDSFPASSGKNSRLSRRISRRGALNRKGERYPSVVPQFQGTPRCLSPFQRNLFSLHCLYFHAEIHSLHHVMSHVGQPCGKPRRKASRESHRSLDPRDGKCDTAATVREESSRACPHTR